ncbi:peptidylprolyl isomerase [Stieleria varia]|uniref:peptidylprolyl isomerase n=1 Tax=Stieleria varia TaxID=2528005 RepID=UPI001E63212A|nr:peptidylprolyl isomerase [Stieleria varia]
MALLSMVFAVTVVAPATSEYSSTCSAQGIAQLPTRDQGNGDQGNNATELPQDPAAVLAVVGQSRILLGDVIEKVDARIKEGLKQANTTVPEEQLREIRLGLVRQELVQLIRSKTMRELFLLEQVATQTAEKRREISKMMDQRAREMFREGELKKLQEVHETEDLAKIDAILRKQGSSIAARQRNFTDAMLGHMYMRSKIDQDPEVTLAEINQYYLSHQEEFSHAAQARWEQLSALFAKHPSMDETQGAITEMGREAFYGGSPTFAPVAKQKSEEPFASDGGLHGWTNRGALASQAIEDQVFSIPLNEMSEVIRDDDGLHIVRVLERKPAGVTPLGDVQDKIRETLKKQKIAKAEQKMIREMEKRVPIWTRFPDDMPGSMPLPESMMGDQPLPSTADNSVNPDEIPRAASKGLLRGLLR